MLEPQKPSLPGGVVASLLGAATATIALVVVLVQGLMSAGGPPPKLSGLAATSSTAASTASASPVPCCDGLETPVPQDDDFLASWDAYTVSGSGTDVVTDLPEADVYLAMFVHQGDSGYVGLSAFDKDGSRELLALWHGAYDETLTYALLGGVDKPAPAKLQIEATGNWQIRFSPLIETPVFEPGVDVDMSLAMFWLEEQPTDVKVTVNGEAGGRLSLVHYDYTEFPTYLITDVPAPWSGTVVIPPGPGFLVAEVQGVSWRIDLADETEPSTDNSTDQVSSTSAEEFTSQWGMAGQQLVQDATSRLSTVQEARPNGGCLDHTLLRSVRFSDTSTRCLP
jgi:hypothetical protein